MALSRNALGLPVSWFDIGYRDGFAGKEYKAKEGRASVRDRHYEGWAQGNMDRIRQAEGEPIVGPVDHSANH